MPLVFLVDDSPLQALVMEKMLSEEGYQVCTFSDGDSLMQQLQNQRPALIISDIEMPGIDGFELLKKVRNKIEARDIPFFLISSRIDDTTEQKANQIGADLFIRKPLERSDLSGRIREYVPFR